MTATSSQTPVRGPSTTLPVKRKSRWFRWFLILGALAVLLVALLMFIAQEYVNSDGFRKMVVGEIRKHVNAEVELDVFAFSLRNGLRIEGLEVGNPEGFGEGPALRVGSATADFKILSLLFGVLDISCKLDSPVAYIIRRGDGKTNLEELCAEASGRVTVNKRPGGSRSSGGIPDTDLHVDTDWLRLNAIIRSGTLEFRDEASGTRRAIRDFEFELGNRSAGAPLILASSGRIEEGSGGDGRFSLILRVATDSGESTHFDFATTGIELATIAPLANAFLDPGFDEFDGRIEGNLGLGVSSDADEITATGDLSVTGLAIVGGPCGVGRGVRAERWTLKPSIDGTLGKGSLSLEGSDVDLGFARLRALPANEALALVPPEAREGVGTAIGVRAEIDLGVLAAQPGILPSGDWKGRPTLSAALWLAEGVAARDFPFVLRLDARDASFSGQSLPEGARLPSGLVLDARGSVPGDSSEALDAKITLNAEGLDAKASVATDRDAERFQCSLDLRVTSEEAATWLATMLPARLGLAGPGRVELDASGRLPCGWTPGDLCAAEGLTVSGKLAWPTLRFLDNELTGCVQELSLADGKLGLRTVGTPKLNGGRLALSLETSGGPGEERAAVRFAWTGGRAGFGSTPVLRYILPLLAGLPTDDLEKIATLDFDSIANLSIEGSGPLAGGTLDDLAPRWTGKGTLALHKGSFTPSTSFARLGSLLGDAKKLRFDKCETRLSITEGWIRNDRLELGGKDGVLVIRGRTSLRGHLDYELDLTDLLRKHRDGRRVIAALGDKKVSAKLTGKLDTPVLALENFASQVLERGLENAVDGFLKGLQGGKSPRRALDDLLRGLRGKD